MATVLNFVPVDYPDRIVFNETTSTYSVSNTGGWGAPNEATTDAVSASLSFGVPGMTDMITIDVSDNLPTTNTALNLAISAEDLGISHIVSGVWKITYTVVTGTTTYTTTKYWWFDAHAQRWLDVQLEGMDLSLLADPMAHALKAPKNQFTNEFVHVRNMYFLLKAACILASRNHVKSAQCIMNFINSQISIC